MPPSPKVNRGKRATGGNSAQMAGGNGGLLGGVLGLLLPVAVYMSSSTCSAS